MVLYRVDITGKKSQYFKDKKMADYCEARAIRDFFKNYKNARIDETTVDRDDYTCSVLTVVGDETKKVIIETSQCEVDLPETHTKVARITANLRDHDCSFDVKNIEDGEDPHLFIAKDSGDFAIELDRKGLSLSRCPMCSDKIVHIYGSSSNGTEISRYYIIFTVEE